MFAYGPAGGEVLSERSKMAPVLVAQDQHQSWPLYVIPAIKNGSAISRYRTSLTPHSRKWHEAG
jgi:hypothetical protein